MRRKRPFPRSSPHSAQAESRAIQNTTISSRPEPVPPLGSALTNVEFVSIAAIAVYRNKSQQRYAARGQEQIGGLPCRGVDQSSVAPDPHGLLGYVDKLVDTGHVGEARRDIAR